MPKPMSVKPECLRASTPSRPVGVDREAKILHGYVLAQEGPFKSDGRGEFSVASLHEIVRLGNQSQKGLKSYLGHANGSEDHTGYFLGRSRNLAMSTTQNAEGRTVQCVRGDLHFNDVAFSSPKGNIGKQVLDLADSDPDAVSSSLVLQADQQFRKDKNGHVLTDKDGNELPPLWMPTNLIGSDVVAVGDAVDGILSAAGYSHPLMEALAAGKQMLDRLFPGQSREVVESRLTDFAKLYCDLRFTGQSLAPDEVDSVTIGPCEVVEAPKLQARLLKLDRMKLAIRENKR